MSKSLQVLFKEYPSLQKDQLWLTYKKKKRQSEKKERRRKKREKKIDKRKQKESE